MDGAILHHPNLTVTLDDIGFDFPHLLRKKSVDVLLAVDDSLSGFLHAARAERVGLPGPAQWRLGFLPGFEKRFVRPFRSKRRVRTVFIEELDAIEGNAGRSRCDPINIFHQPLTFDSWHGCSTSPLR